MFDITRAQSRLEVSFEFFPPKSEEMEDELWRSIQRLAPLNPKFVSVTYGAGGSTRERTHATVKRIIDETALHPAAHLTCVGAPRAEIDGVVQAYWDVGVRHIVALRGDSPEGPGMPYRAHADGYQSTAELVAAIKRRGAFEVSVSAYPEKHPDSRDFAEDIDLLKRKIDAGADRAITQFAFDTELHARFRDSARRSGITIPIVPGIMPTTNFKGVRRMAGRCGASIPRWLDDLFADLEQEAGTRLLVSACVAAEQAARLEELGFDQLHFYTLNKADLVYSVCHIMGLRTKQRIAA